MHIRIWDTISYYNLHVCLPCMQMNHVQLHIKSNNLHSRASKTCTCGTCSNCSISAALYFQPANFVFLCFFCVCNCEKMNNVTASPLRVLPPPKKRLEYLDATYCHFSQNLLNPLNFCQNNRIFIVQLNMTRRHVILEFFQTFAATKPSFCGYRSIRKRDFQIEKYLYDLIFLL